MKLHRKGVLMDEFVCDYACRTVGEGIIKHSIPDDWCAEFDIYDVVCPVVCIQVSHIRRLPALMDLKIRIAKNEDEEYAGCMVLAEKKTIAFKIDHRSDLAKAMEENSNFL